MAFLGPNKQVNVEKKDSVGIPSSWLLGLFLYWIMCWSEKNYTNEMKKPSKK